MLEPEMIEDLCSEKKYEWIILDEIQRLPKLLNIVHRMIEKYHQKFALTGSSSRKLKRGGANLLAGRAFVNILFPFTYLEIQNQFDIDHALHWGTLPKILSLSSDAERKAYLRSYCLTYIKEEIQAEQIVRNLEPFREFLTVAAQSSGNIINYSSVSRDVGVQVPTVQSYFQILEETYLGLILPHYHRSVRKSQIQSPKFYFFDNGVKKALEASLDSKPVEGTSQFGDLFESFVIQEIHRLNEYFQRDFRLSFFQTKHGAEVDLVLSKGRQVILVEIKSTKRVDEIEVRKLARIAHDFGDQTRSFYLSRDKFQRIVDGVECWFWSDFPKNFFGASSMERFG